MTEKFMIFTSYVCAINGAACPLVGDYTAGAYFFAGAVWLRVI